MMIGCPTPTIEPLFGTNDGAPNGAVPVNGVGSCPSAVPAAAGSATGGAQGGGGGAGGAATTPGSPGSGSASAGPVPSTSKAAIPAALRAAKRLPLVQP